LQQYIVIVDGISNKNVQQKHSVQNKRGKVTLDNRVNFEIHNYTTMLNADYHNETNNINTKISFRTQAVKFEFVSDLDNCIRQNSTVYITSSSNTVAVHSLHGKGQLLFVISCN
jgi:hypothetical protein